MIRVACFVMLAWLGALAAPSERLPLPAPLQAEQIPWFAARDGRNPGAPYTRTLLSRWVNQNQAKRVALVYFTTWCQPCREGVLELRQQAQNLQAQKLAVVLVHVGVESDSLVNKWVHQFAMPQWPIVRDPFGRLTEGFGLIAEGQELPLPRTLVLDQNLKALLHISAEGDDWPFILWE